ncbi:HAMP domain-containing sensor histidine kinase [Thermopolyspora sp. NPDC052614]|uniref:sensor histidine kinase n=1 Tax=Thermopolyspora sp. NPDC052614 TaxID=3155682 RepID=UPI00341872A0
MIRRRLPGTARHPATPGRVTAGRRWRGPRTLRGRLIAGLLVLLALACAAVGLASTLALGRFLVSQLDARLTQDRGRFASSLEHGERDTRGQSPGTFGARLMNGRVTHAAAVAAPGSDEYGSVLTPDDEYALAALPADGVPRTVELHAIDEYRMRAVPGRDGDVLVTGLPMEGVEATVRRLQTVELVVFAGVLAVTGLAGTVWVRLSLRPLRRVAATAGEVTKLPLASGRVTLPDPVPDAEPYSEVGQVAAAFNRMLGHVEDALARRHAGEQRLRAFAADAGHELRTPLAAVRGYVELARRHPGPLPDEVRHALERVQAESDRMAALVDDLLLLARLDAGRPLLRQEVDVTRLAIDATGDARVAGPGHRWRLELPEEPVTVLGDPGRIHQVLANLLANARVHTPEGSTVTVSVRETPAPPGSVELTVADDGPGIPAEFQREIFERFARADKARSRASGGTGLGLAIVRAVVAAHHGTVEVTSEPGHTVFRVVFPKAPPEPPPEPPLVPPPEPPPAVSGDLAAGDEARRSDGG